MVRFKQSGDLEAYINEFTGLCLEVPELDEMTKITLFVEGLSSLVVKKEVRRDHPKTLAAAIRAARLAEIEEKETRGITEHDVTFIRSDRPDTSSRWSYLSKEKREERERLYKAKLCFKCKRPGHIAANCRQDIRLRREGVESSPKAIHQ